ncbi:hypothetical protein VNO78_02088 [Psophocarpus tetragonolobus]|uniref:Uncharacterized protein n=1 Tax=Psophocarpus tetragonolobus TaxID=3891 RepID=A0AAN9T137_PSOTE
MQASSRGHRAACNNLLITVNARCLLFVVTFMLYIVSSWQEKKDVTDPKIKEDAERKYLEQEEIDSASAGRVRVGREANVVCVVRYINRNAIVDPLNGGGGESRLRCRSKCPRLMLFVLFALQDGGFSPGGCNTLPFHVFSRTVSSDAQQEFSKYVEDAEVKEWTSIGNLSRVRQEAARWKGEESAAGLYKCCQICYCTVINILLLNRRSIEGCFIRRKYKMIDCSCSVSEVLILGAV